MVHQPLITTGIDTVGSDYLTAQVEKTNSHTKVLALSKIAGGEISRSLLSDNGEIILSVPDNEMIMKHLSIPADYQGSRDGLIKFELKQALLDDPADFCFDTIETTDRSQVMTMVARKERLKKRSCVIQIGEDASIEPAGFVPRSVALGNGFIQYCANDTERLVGLIDFCTERAAVSFVLGSRIVATASFDRSAFDPATDSGFGKLAAELKTITNFKLSELSRRGLDLTFDRLIFTGSTLDNTQKESLAARLEVQLEQPIFDRVLSDSPLVENDIPLADFLVPLGLTVK